jgi:two-component system CheB/CheR fusion protein
MLVQHVVVSSAVLLSLENVQYLLPQNQSMPRDLVNEATDEQRRERGRRALIVDDVADVTEMLSVLFSHAGYEVETADSALKALSRARESQFDIVISDIGMPEMNGYELVQKLRATPGYETIPMVALTGYAMFNDRRKSLAAGFNAHVTKPIDPRALLDLIDQL